MTLLQQLSEALFRAPQSLIYIRKRSMLWLSIYLVSGLALFALTSWLLVDNQEAIKSALLDHFFPQSWHEFSEPLANFLFETQTKVVVGNLILGASLVIASTFLFPIKEKFSSEFEKDAKYQNGPREEFPLWLQAWEEGQLLIFYLTTQLVILWLGYYPFVWTKGLSIVLSYLFLFFTFGVDFISPTLQRHRTAYSLILKVLIKKPLLVITFGALYSLPVVILSRFIFTDESLTVIEIAGILFMVNIFFLTLAVPAGTRIASMLMPTVKRTLPLQKKNKIRGYTLMLVTLVIMSFLHGRLIASLHHKSQLLKANYSIDWSSIDYQLPTLNEFFNGKALSNLSFDMVIRNPTEFDIVIEQSQILVNKSDKRIATLDLSGFEIPAGEERKVKLKVDSTSDISQIRDLNLLTEGWRIDLQFELWPGIPFILNITE